MSYDDAKPVYKLGHRSDAIITVRSVEDWRRKGIHTLLDINSIKTVSLVMIFGQE